MRAFSQILHIFHTSSFMYFALIFSECMTIPSSEEVLKVCEHNFFRQKVVLLVIYLSNHGSSKSTIFMLIMAFDVLLTSFLSNQLEFFVSCNIKLFALCFDVFYFGIPKKWEPNHGTRDSGLMYGTGTRISGSIWSIFTSGLGPETLHLGSGALYVGARIQYFYVKIGTHT